MKSLININAGLGIALARKAVMSFIKLLLLFQIITFALTQAQAVTGIIRIDVAELRPTQMNVGMIEVQRKADKLSSMSKEERDLFLQQNPVPVIIGPNPRKNLYLIDHHHLSRALLVSGHHHLYIKIVADLSDLSKEEFWQEMETRGYVYLKDIRGYDIRPSQLPKTVAELGDDPYRSLAGVVRRHGGFSKDVTPFAEFQWAAFFRQRVKIDPRKGKSSFRKATEEALSLVGSRDATQLPGYRPQCKIIF